MRFTVGVAKVNSWLLESFAKKSSVKLLGGLAVSAMLITVATFTYDQLRRDEAVSPSSSSQIAEASQASAYWVQRDEAEEMAYDELSKSFVGIAYPSSQIKSSFRIMEEQRVADRQEDLKDMIRYWDQLKKKEVEDEMD